MNMKLYRQLIFILVLLCCASCVTKIKCPTFNTTYLEWIPYQEGDTILFEYGKESKEYVVHSYKAYHSNNYPSNIKCCGCNDKIELLIKGVYDSLNIRILYNNLMKGEDVLNLPMIICNKASYKAERTDNLFLFNNTPNDNSIKPDNSISKIIIRKDIGIVAFNMNNIEWTLKERRKYQVSNNIQIINEDYH